VSVLEVYLKGSTACVFILAVFYGAHPAISVHFKLVREPLLFVWKLLPWAVFKGAEKRFEVMENMPPDLK
jgi:hypothetical protein